MYKVEQICDNPEKGLYKAICVADSHIVSDCVFGGTDRGTIVGWNLNKNMSFQYYAINEDLV